MVLAVVASWRCGRTASGWHRVPVQGGRPGARGPGGRGRASRPVGRVPGLPIRAGAAHGGAVRVNRTGAARLSDGGSSTIRAPVTFTMGVNRAAQGVR